MEEDPTYEGRMGKWVTDRCKKRAREVEEMPYYVKLWLDTGGKSPADENTAPTVRVLGWLAKTAEDPTWNTIEDPDWPRSKPS